MSRDAPLGAVVHARVLADDGAMRLTNVYFRHGTICEIGDRSIRGVGLLLDARGALLLPGMVDLHCESLEKHLAPRGSTQCDVRAAEAMAVRDCLSWGVTSPCFTVTASLEPGPRSVDQCAQSLDELTVSRAALRVELIAVSDRVLRLMRHDRVASVCINNHAANPLSQWDDAAFLRYVRSKSRIGAGDEARLLEATRQPAVAWYERVRRVANGSPRPVGYHDLRGRDLAEFCAQNHVRYAEFAVDEDTARWANRLGMPLVLGAPNVVRGGSHNGQIGAAQAIEQGWCTMLCSDYHLPSLFHAPFVLARAARLPLSEAWRLVSRNPARLLGLTDRGEVVPGQAADLIVATDGLVPEIAAVIQQGTVKVLNDPRLLRHCRRGARARGRAAHSLER